MSSNLRSARAYWIIVAASLLMTLTLSMAGLADTGGSQSYWTIGSCTLWGDEFYNSTTGKAKATVWDSNGNCGTVKVRMYYWVSGNLYLTSWYSHPTATSVSRTASDGEKGQYQGSGVTKSLLH